MDRPGFRVQLDTGSLSLTGESTDRTIERAFGFIGHVHVSEPHLRPIETVNGGPPADCRGSEASGIDGWVSLEMRSGARPSIPHRSTPPSATLRTSMADEAAWQLPIADIEFFRHGGNEILQLICIPVLN